MTRPSSRDEFLERGTDVLRVGTGLVAAIAILDDQSGLYTWEGGTEFKEAVILLRQAHKLLGHGHFKLLNATIQRPEDADAIDPPAPKAKPGPKRTPDPATLHFQLAPGAVFPPPSYTWTGAEGWQMDPSGNPGGGYSGFASTSPANSGFTGTSPANSGTGAPPDGSSDWGTYTRKQAEGRAIVGGTAGHPVLEDYRAPYRTFTTIRELDGPADPVPEPGEADRRPGYQRPSQNVDLECEAAWHRHRAYFDIPTTDEIAHHHFIVGWRSAKDVALDAPVDQPKEAEPRTKDRRKTVRQCTATGERGDCILPHNHWSDHEFLPAPRTEPYGSRLAYESQQT